MHGAKAGVAARAVAVAVAGVAGRHGGVENDRQALRKRIPEAS